MNIFAEKPGKTYSIILDLPPSAKFILYILDRKGKLNRKQIERETLLPRRTVGYALKMLTKYDLVKKSIPEKIGKQSVDLRNKFYQILY